jgi:hypothetical protein
VQTDATSAWFLWLLIHSWIRCLVLIGATTVSTLFFVWRGESGTGIWTQVLTC